MAILGNLIFGQRLVLLIGAVNGNILPAHELHAEALGWAQLFLSQLLDGRFNIVHMPFS